MRQQSIEERIVQWLEDEAPRDLPEDVLQAAFERTRQRPQRSGGFAWPGFRLPVLRAFTAAALAVVLVAGLVVVLRPGDAGFGSAPTASPVPASASATASVLLAEFETFDVPGAYAVTATADAVWATSSGRVIRIDADGASTAVDLPVASFSGIAASESLVWAASHERRAMWSIDPVTLEVSEEIELSQAPFAIQADGDRLLVPVETGMLVLDARSGEEIRTLPMRGTFAFGDIWVAGVQAVFRVSVETGEVETTIATPRVTYDCGLSAWPVSGVDGMSDSIVMGCFEGRTLTRIDAETNTVVGTYDIGPNGGNSIAVAGGWWVPVGTEAEPGLARIDPATGAVVEVRSLGANNGPEGMAVALDALWIATEPADRVLRIPLESLTAP